MKTLYCLMPIFVVLALVVPVFAGEGVVNELVVYSAAMDEWLQNASVKCTYELHVGFAKDWESALRGEFVGKTEKIKGEIAKLGQMVRYSQKYPGGPISVDGNAMSKTNISTETLLKPGLRLRGNFDNADMHLEQDKEHPGELHLRGVVHDINPFAMTGAGLLGGPLRLILKSSAVVDASSVETLNDGSIAIHVATHIDGEKSKTKVVLNVSSGYPICEIYEQETEVKPGRMNVTRVQVSDWRQCGRVVVPARIVFVETWKEMGVNAKVRLKVWQSKDLGDADPTVADFVVKVPAKTRVYNVKDYPLMAMDKRDLDFNSLGVGSVGKEGDAVPESAGASKWVLRLVLLGVVVVGGAIATWRRLKVQV